MAKNGIFFKVLKDQYTGDRRLYKVTYQNGKIIKKELATKQIFSSQASDKLIPVPEDDYFDYKSLMMGISIEREHTNSDEVAKMIAKHHLMENPNYYDSKIGIGSWEETLPKN